MQLLLQSIKQNFKYQVLMAELYFHEQWSDKSFVMNLVKLFFQILILGINLRLCYWIFIRGHFPIYLIGEIIDTSQELN